MRSDVYAAHRAVDVNGVHGTLQDRSDDRLQSCRCSVSDQEVLRREVLRRIAPGASRWVFLLVLGVLCGMSLMTGRAWGAFGVAPGSVEMVAVEKNGTVDTRAGSHPYAFTVNFAFNSNGPNVEGNVRDIEVDLPAGLIGNPLAVPRCSRELFDTGVETECPGNTQVGFLEAEVSGATIKAPVFDLVPPPGVPVRLGVQASGLSAIEDASLNTGKGYGPVVNGHNIPTPEIGKISETIWGVPYDSGHDPQRRCVESNGENKFGCSLSEVIARPFLTLPPSCSGPLSVRIMADSTETPGLFPANALTEEGFLHESGGNPVGLSGCENLPFQPVVSVQPETGNGSAGVFGGEEPAGLNVDLKIPQPETNEGLSEADLKEAVVRLPEGMTVSPSAANGLGGCPLLRGRDEAKEERESRREEDGINLESTQPANCPDDSKVGSVEVETPLLERPVKGAVFLAQQGNLPGNGSNPFGTLFALYIVAESEGVIVKIPGELSVGENGQLTAHFGKDPITGEESLPEVPYSDLRMHFFGGARAPLITPSACGAYATTAQLTPFGNDPNIGPVSPSVDLSDAFTVAQDCSGQGFSPSFTAGTTNNQADAYSPLLVTFSRKDREQRFSGLQVTEPPGLLATLKNATQCPEPQASQGACPSSSLIGETTAAAGPGEDPYWVKGGKVFLTGPYKNAPFGLSVMVPAIAGPFNLGTVVVRAAITVDPHTAQATITSDPLPTTLQNIPLDIRTVNVLVNRPGFIFNPTNCAPQTTTATITSTTAD